MHVRAGGGSNSLLRQAPKAGAAWSMRHLRHPCHLLASGTVCQVANNATPGLTNLA